MCSVAEATAPWPGSSSTSLRKIGAVPSSTTGVIMDAVQVGDMVAFPRGAGWVVVSP